MNTFYSKETNVQILVSLMKQHGIRKIIASPGTTNINFVASVQSDPYFEMYSSVDERSAAYMACGLAAASGEPVALSCTGATASRNYIPGLTEAYYRKLPVLAITATQHEGRIGQNIAQVIDRRAILNDMVRLSIQAPIPHTEEDRWALNVQLNRALLELKRQGGGPVHINLETAYNNNFSVKELPVVRAISRFTYSDNLPTILSDRVIVRVGEHGKWSDTLTENVDAFCEKYNGVVFCDHTSNYRGQYRVFPSLVMAQEQYYTNALSADLIIDIGNIPEVGGTAKEVWRVNPDGEIRDPFKKLTKVFEMNECDFFKLYNSRSSMAEGRCEYYKEVVSEQLRLRDKIPKLPFSNIWIAQQTAGRLPENSILYLGILHTLRSWNFFETPASVTCYSNTGGFGIDGGVSALLGMSLADKDHICIGIIGDLGFFYDMNALGNRHVGNNFRLMLINNGCGTEFKNYNHPAAAFQEDADAFMAARGHFGQQSRSLVKHYAEDLGFAYMSASNKEEYLRKYEHFISPEKSEQPILFEIFTDSQDESNALKMIRNLETSVSGSAKKLVKDIFGEKGIQKIKKVLNK